MEINTNPSEMIVLWTGYIKVTNKTSFPLCISLSLTLPMSVSFLPRSFLPSPLPHPSARRTPQALGFIKQTPVAQVRAEKMRPPPLLPFYPSTHLIYTRRYEGGHSSPTAEDNVCRLLLDTPET